MTRLTEVSTAWRNYLYTNSNSIRKDIDDFKIRVQLISDSHEDLLKTMLLDEPDMELVKACKKEIAFQREQLEDMIIEFVDYPGIPDGLGISANDILTDLSNEGTTHYLYVILEEWENIGTRAHSIWWNLNKQYDFGLFYLQDDLCRLILDNFYENPSLSN